MKALSIRQPWAWLIVNGHKDIENRSWSTSYRGAFYVHAAQKFDVSNDDLEWLQETLWKRSRTVVPMRHQFKTGGIVGVASIVDVVDRSSSPWFIGPIGFVLDGAHPMRFIECKGRLSFFDAEV